jgi:hypothetical protein
MPELLSAPIEWWLASAPRLLSPVYPWLNAGHILSLALLVGGIAALDLRLLGAFRDIPAAHLARPAVRIAGWGLAFALATGALLFSVQPAHYLANPAFLAKLALVSVGMVNAVALRRLPGWRAVLGGGPVPVTVKLAALVSLASWVAAVFAGRWIAYL